MPTPSPLHRPPEDPVGSIPISDPTAAPGTPVITAPPGAPPRRPRRASRRPGPGIKAVLVLVVLVLLYILVGSVLVPRLLTGVVAAQLSRRLNREVIVTRAEFSPFSWRFSLTNLLVGPDREMPESLDDPLFSLERISGAIVPAGLLTGSLLLDDLTVTAPLLHIVRAGDGRYNISEVFSRLSAAGAPSLFLPRLVPRRIALEQGTLLFDDLVSGGHHRVENISLNLPALPTAMAEFASLPSTAAAPSLHATVDGSPIDLLGEVRPGRRGADTVFHLSLASLAIAPYRHYLPPPLRETLQSGTIDGTIDFILSASAELTLGLQLAGSDIAFGGEGLQSGVLERVRLEATVLPGRRRLDCREISIEAPALDLVRDAGGWQMPAAGPLPSLLAGLASGDSAWQITVDRGRLRAPRGSFANQEDGRTFSLALAQVELSVDKIAPDSPGAFRLLIGDMNGGRLEGGGSLAFSPVAVQGEFQLQGLNLLTAKTALPPTIHGGGIESLSCRVTADGQTLRLDDLRASLRDLHLIEAGISNITIPHLTIDQGSLVPADRQLTVGRLTAAGAPVQARFLLAAPPPVSPDAPAAPDQTVTSSQNTVPHPAPPAWRFSLGEASADRLDLSLERPGRQPLILSVQGLHLTALAPDTPSILTATGRFADGGDLDLGGSVRISPWSATVEVELIDLPLAAYPGIFAPWLTARISAGTLRGAGTVTLPGMHLRGEAIIEGFTAGTATEPVLAWQRATIEEIDISARECTTGTVSIERPELFWDIAADRGSNLAALLTAGRDQGGFRVALPEILITDGTLTHRNRSLAPPAEIVISAITGVLSDTETVAGNRTGLELQGLSRQGGLVSVTGTMAFFDPRLSADLAVRVADQPLAPMSPQLQEGLGHELAGGTLELRSNVRVGDGRISGDNGVTLKGLRLGDKLQSASRLELALALLADADDSIALSLPVEGDIGDGNFSYLRAMMQNVRNLALKTAVSPFSLLPPLADGGRPPESIAFPFGSSRLEAGESSRLEQLADLLRQRPRPHLLLTGQADMQGDGAALEKLYRQQTAETRQREAAALVRQAGREVIERPPPPAAAPNPAAADLPEKTRFEALARARAARVRAALMDLGIDGERLRENERVLLIPAASPKKAGNLVNLQLLPPTDGTSTP
ncbi:MAG: DUF748 domain-containing protein [Thermodesulfobacteriota bacterium]